MAARLLPPDDQTSCEPELVCQRTPVHHPARLDDAPRLSLGCLFEFAWTDCLSAEAFFKDRLLTQRSCNCLVLNSAALQNCLVEHQLRTINL
jgi:hypothetical protein